MLPEVKTYTASSPDSHQNYFKIHTCTSCFLKMMCLTYTSVITEEWALQLPQSIFHVLVGARWSLRNLNMKDRQQPNVYY